MIVPTDFSAFDIDNTYYGGYRTRTFADIFPSYDEFLAQYNDTEFSSHTDINDKLSLVYYLLYARYGNSHIAFSDENQFIYNVFSILFMYGPTWAKRLETQDKLRALTDEELFVGSSAIYNHAYNDGGAPSTATLTEIETINEQNTTKYRKSKMDAYANLLALLETDVTEEFISKFRKAFIKVIAPDRPLLYITEDSNI